MTNKPIWLLDVDGVINACAPGARIPAISWWPRDTWKLVDGIAMGQKWPIRYSTAMIDRINELSELAEIRWHTTWQFDAPGLGELLGLNKFKVAWDYAKWKSENGTERMWGWYPKGELQYEWWKMYHAVDAVLLEKRPLIWTDDDLTQFRQKLFIDETMFGEQPSLLVRPRTDTGLTKEDLDSIASFISENSGS